MLYITNHTYNKFACVFYSSSLLLVVFSQLTHIQGFQLDFFDR